MSKNHVISRLLAATTAAFTLTSGCVMTADDARDETFSSRQASAQLSDEELFREILFPNAASAAKVPELARIYEAVHFDQLDQAQLDAVTAFEDLIVARIHDDDPTFFAAFRTEVTSGDVLRVDAAMTDAHDVMSEAVGSLNESFSVLMQSDSLDVLRNGMHDELGPEVLDVLDRLDHLDPVTLVQLQEIFEHHLDMFDIPLDPSLGIDMAMGIQTSQQINSMIDTATQTEQGGDPLVNVYFQVEVVVWAVVAAAVAAAVVAVVVVAVVVPFGSAQYINGESAALYRDQLVFNIAEAYAS